MGSDYSLLPKGTVIIMEYKKPNIFLYRLTQLLAWFAAHFMFHRKFLRNELKKHKGPAVVIANHECALDFVNLIGATRRPMNFVISNSFYNTLPIKKILKGIGVIPKQQFQTAVIDVRLMKETVDNGGILALYPAGLMCEDGISTPIPTATYRFLQFLRADVYVAKTTGAYFVSPKWSKKKRPGRTYLDVYRLATAEELSKMSPEVFAHKAEEALVFDAYREQDELRIKYKKPDIEGLENVLYMCSHCKREFSMQVKDGYTLYCNECGYELVSDEYYMLNNKKGLGEELRYVSDYSRRIYSDLEEKIERGELLPISDCAKIQTIDYKKKKFTDAGEGKLTLTDEHIILEGTANGEPVSLSVPISAFPSLPFSPGKYLELQHGEQIYRLVLRDGRQVMKFINVIKIFYQRHAAPKKA